MPSFAENVETFSTATHPFRRMVVACVFILLCAPVCAQKPQRAASPPNILWITCEDMSPNLPSFGDSTVATPNLSRLAAEGIRYTRAYTTAGVCAPSRAAMITGIYASSIGAHNMRTASGKRAGFIDYETVPPPDVKAFTEYLRANGYYCSNNAKTDYQFGTPFTAWDESGFKAHWRNRPEGMPFFSVFNVMRTHESEIWKHAGKPLRVSPANVPLPPYYPESNVIRTDIARYYDNIMVMDSLAGVILSQLEADGLLQNTIVFFFSDHGAGLPWFKREIYTRGIHVPLIVRFPDRQGAGTERNELVSMIDLAPTVLSLAGVPIPSNILGKPFLGPQKAAEERTHVFAARDRMDELNDMARAVRDDRYLYIRNYQPEKPYYQDLPYRRQMAAMQEILRMRDAGQLTGYTQRWFGVKAAEELYDTRADPFELTNLASDPAHRSRLEKYRALLAAWSVETGDKGFIPERDLIEMMWPDNTQPTTSAPLPTVTYPDRRNASISVGCDTEGASIGYQLRGEERWRLYVRPITVPVNTAVKFRAVRYGYKASEEVEVKTGKQAK